MGFTISGLARARAGVALRAADALDTGERVVLDLGFVVLYRVPVSVLLFGATFAGMLLMFLAGLPTDLKVRRMLRDRPERLDREL